MTMPLVLEIEVVLFPIFNLKCNILVESIFCYCKIGERLGQYSERLRNMML